MCTYSAVMDRWQPIFPPVDPHPIPPMPIVPWVLPPPPPNTTWPELIEKFRKEAEAARQHDIDTKQPDCEDPEKAKLVDRVAELERRLALIEREVGLREAK